jgi:hypothetical protein
MLLCVLELVFSAFQSAVFTPEGTEVKAIADQVGNPRQESPPS